MKASIFVKLSLVLALAVFGSACSVKCEFVRRVKDPRKGDPRREHCEGSIIICNSSGGAGSGKCENTLQMSCEGQKIYFGPYTVAYKGNSIKYIASDWHGEDAPFIESIVPSTTTPVDAWLVDDDDSRSKGSCQYTALPAGL